MLLNCLGEQFYQFGGGCIRHNYDEITLPRIIHCSLLRFFLQELFPGIGNSIKHDHAFDLPSLLFRFGREDAAAKQARNLQWSIPLALLQVYSNELYRSVEFDRL